MHLLQAPIGQELEIVKIREKKSERDNQDRHLTNLGFIEGAKVTVVAENEGNLIVKIKDSRVAIGRDIAKKIIVK